MSDTASSTAGMSHGSASTTTRTTARTTTTQRLVRVAGGASPFVWRGLLPLLGLAGVFWFATAPFAVRDVQATVAREVKSALVQKDMGWVNVAVSGQDVLLRGAPPRAGAGDEALAVARAATCPTWAGPLTCAVTVLGAFGSPAVSLPSAAAATAPSSPSAPAAPPMPAVAPAPPAAALAACEAAFARLLERSRIEFASGGAAIDARSAQLLDKLAETARGCPGRILVEGHTDDVGNPDANQRLSEARAAAVREALLKRGIAATQIEALGYGQSKPLADNANEAGRAANRRIEFKALP